MLARNIICLDSVITTLSMLKFHYTSTF